MAEKQEGRGGGSSYSALRSGGGDFGGIGSERDDDARANEVATELTTRTSVVSRSNSRTLPSAATETASTVGGRSVEGARAAELLDLQRELSEARLQIVGAKKENQMLAKALQDSKQRQNDAESIVSELSGHQAHLDQVPELLQEVSKLNSQLQQQEGIYLFSQPSNIWRPHFHRLLFSF